MQAIDDPNAARRAAFWQGFTTVLPTMIAIGAWGLVTGVAMIKSGLSVGWALVMTLTVFAGSAQLVALPLIAAHAPVWLVLAAATIVNLRFVVFSAALHPFFQRFSKFKRLGLGYFTSDIGFVMFMQRYGDRTASSMTPQELQHQTWYFIGIATCNVLVWQITSIAGILLATRVPTQWTLEFAATLALLALIIPLAKTRPALGAIVVAAMVALLTMNWPLKLGLLAAVLAGVVAGIVLEKRMSPAADQANP